MLVHWMFVRWICWYIKSLYIGYVGTLNLCTLDVLVHWMFVRWIFLYIKSLYIGYVGTLNLCTLDMLVHWMFVHWICWYIECLYIGYVGTLNVCTLDMLVHWMFVHWICWYIECLYIGYVGTLNLCTLDMLVHWMFVRWICWYIKCLYIGYVGTLIGKSLGRLSSLMVDCNYTNPFVGLMLKSEQQIDAIPTTEYSKNDGQQLKLNSKSCLAQNKNLSPTSPRKTEHVFRYVCYDFKYQHWFNFSGFLVKFFLCFSLLRNSRAVFKTDVTPGTVTSLFGLRVLSILWVILGHVYVFSRHLDGITGMFMAFDVCMILTCREDRGRGVILTGPLV